MCLFSPWESLFTLRFLPHPSPPGGMSARLRAKPKLTENSFHDSRLLALFCRNDVPNPHVERPYRTDVPNRRDRKNKKPGQSELTTTADITIVRRKLTPLKPVTPSTANGRKYKVPASARKAVQKTGWSLLSRGLCGAKVGFSRTVRSADFRGSLR